MKRICRCRAVAVILVITVMGLLGGFIKSVKHNATSKSGAVSEQARPGDKKTKSENLNGDNEKAGETSRDAKMPNKSDDLDKTHKTDKLGEEGRLDLSDKADPSDKAGTPDKTVTSDKTDLPDRADLPGESDEAHKTDMPDKTDLPGKTDGPDKTDMPEKTDEPDKVDLPDKTGSPDKTDTTGKTDSPDKTDKTSCSHSWVKIYKTERVCVEEAWDEEIYEKHIFCNYCGVDLTLNPDPVHETYCGERVYNEDMGIWVYTGANTITKSVLIDRVAHPARYENRKIEAGYRCSGCGEIKP